VKGERIKVKGSGVQGSEFKVSGLGDRKAGII
jgi:hypothetical protein